MTPKLSHHHGIVLTDNKFLIDNENNLSDERFANRNKMELYVQLCIVLLLLNILKAEANALLFVCSDRDMLSKHKKKLFYLLIETVLISIP